MTAPVAVPNTADDLKETLLDKGKLKALIDEGNFAEFMTNYNREFNKANTDVSENVQEQIDTAIANFAREHAVEFRKNGKRLSPAEVREDRQTTGRWSKHAEGTALDGKFSDLMDFLTACNGDAAVRDESGQLNKKRGEIRNAMSSTDPSQGGFLIPEEFRTELLRVALETAVVRPRARVIPMSSLRASMPMIDSTTNNGSVYGGVIAFWTEEGAALAQSQPNFGRIVLEAKKLTAYTEVPNELDKDSAISIDALVNETFPEAISFFEDIAFLRGSGVGEPLGVLTAGNTALLQVAAEAGQSGTNTLVWENLINMYSRLLPGSMGSAVWLAAPNTFPQLATMALSVGTGGSAVWLNNGVEGPPMTILGRPVIFTEKATALGGLGDIALIDFKQYLIGDRMAMDAKVSEHYKFGNDMVAYRFIERVDGRPWLQSAVTPQNGGPTLSPYVTLAAGH